MLRSVSTAALAVSLAAALAVSTPAGADDTKPANAVAATSTVPPQDAPVAPDAAKPEIPPAAPAANAAVATPATETPLAMPAPQMSLPANAPAIEAVQPNPAFALAAEITERLKRERVSGAAEREDRDAALAVYEARQGEPIWITPLDFNDKAVALINELRGADSYGLVASQFRLPDIKLNASNDQLADTEVTLTLSALKYARHARGGRVDPTALSKDIDRKPVVYAPGSVLTELAAAARPGAYLRSFHPQHPQFERLRLKYVALRSGQSVLEPPAAPAAAANADAKSKRLEPLPVQPSRAALERKLLANLEMWRWMPVDMGDYHIQNNIPEFTTRMVKGGKVVHLERIVTGKPDTQTPVFSDYMQVVVFKPFWNVPDSIKWKELQPQLARNPGALAKSGLKASYNGREVDPETVDWSSADMRAFHVFQPPGAGNALGQVKFLFPNKHDVYMHDTPHKSLFNQTSRAYSHGCMRVRDPLKFAELLLANDKGWDMRRIADLAANGPENNEIRLTRKVPIHITYFTAWVEDDGKLKTFNDLYGHETRVHMGLEGKAHLIAQVREEKYQPPNRGSVRFVQKQGGAPDWLKSLFSF